MGGAPSPMWLSRQAARLLLWACFLFPYPPHSCPVGKQLPHYGLPLFNRDRMGYPARVRVQTYPSTISLTKGRPEHPRRQARGGLVLNSPLLGVPFAPSTVAMMTIET